MTANNAPAELPLLKYCGLSGATAALATSVVAAIWTQWPAAVPPGLVIPTVMMWGLVWTFGKRRATNAVIEGALVGIVIALVAVRNL